MEQLTDHEGCEPVPPGDLASRLRISSSKTSCRGGNALTAGAGAFFNLLIPLMAMKITTAMIKKSSPSARMRRT